MKTKSSAPAGPVAAETAAAPVARPAPASPARPTALILLVLIALVVFAVARSVIGTRLDSVTPDEPWHIVAGVEYQRTGDYRLNPEHPPLIKRWVGAWMPASFVVPQKTPIVEKEAEREFVEETFFAGNDFRAAHRRARVAMYGLSALLLLGLALVVWHALGPVWAVGTTAFLALEPTVSAHLPVVMTDAPVALTLGMAALAGGLAVTTWRWRWILVFGVAMGLALASKHSALPGLAGIGLFATAAAIAQVVRANAVASRATKLRALAIRAGKLAASALIAFGVLWAAYDFQFHAGPDGSDSFNRPLTEKLAELQSPLHRTVIGGLDRRQLLPRSYLWGLVDTIRAGVEGRAQNEHLLWGRRIVGEPPWYTWPSFILSKVPLALLGLTVAGGVAIRRLRLTAVQRGSLLALLAMAAFHLLALLTSKGTYAGVRHALPIVVAFAVISGATAAAAWAHRSRGWAGITLAGLLLVFGMTIGEPRLWEYHNLLAGGTARAGHLFANEGVDLGQRAYEIAAFNDSVIAPSGEALYSSYWLPEPHARALGIPLTERVETMTDTNVDGRYRGYFLYETYDEISRPEWDWHPEEVLAGLERVARFGYASIWYGEQVVPGERAEGVYGRVIRYIYVEGGDDWELVALRLEELLAVHPFVFAAAIELGNAYLRLGRPADARRAYALPLDHVERGIINDASRRLLEEQIAKLDAGEPVEVLRNPWLE